MKIFQIHPSFVNSIWPDVERFIVSGLIHSAGEFTPDQLRMLAARGEQSLLVALDDNELPAGAACVAFDDFPNARIAFITSVGGRNVSTAEILDQLRDWCRERGATRIRGVCSESVARLWKQKFNFEQRYIVVEHAL